MIPDREKVINGLRICFMQKDCDGCPYQKELRAIIDKPHNDDWHCPILDDVLALLKEQEETIEELQNAYGYLQKQFFEAQDELLKEQEAKNGYWINPTSQDCHCSECGEQPMHEPGESVPLYDFCPYCGAKMEVKWNE